MKNVYKIELKKGTERLATFDPALHKCICKLLNCRGGA